jgi:hypothetical protein
MSARQRFQQAQQRAVLDARSRIHAQTDFTKDRSQILQSISDKTYTPTKTAKETMKYALVASRTNRAAALADRYRHQARAALVEQARKTLEEIPSFTLDDDPHFEGCRRILQAAKTFKMRASDVPAVDCSATLILKHSYLVPHEPAAALAAALPTIYPSTSANDARHGAVGRFKSLSGRLRQLAPDALVSESAVILSTAAKLGVRDRDTFQAFTNNVLEFHENATVGDLCRCLESVSRAAETAAEVLAFLEAVSEHLCEHAGDLTALDCLMIIVAVGRVGEVTNRKLMYLVCDRLVAVTEDLTTRQCADVISGLQRTGYRHQALMRRLCNRQLLAAPRMPGPAVATTLNALSLTAEAVDVDDELFEALLERLTELETGDLSLSECVQVMAALARPALQLDGDSEGVVADRVLLAVYANTTPTVRDRAIVEALVNIQAIGWHRRPRGVEALRLLSEELGRRGGLPADNSELLGAAGRALEAMLNDRQADRQSLGQALGPLVQ